MIKEFKFQKFEDVSNDDNVIKEFAFKKLNAADIEQTKLGHELELVEKSSFKVMEEVKNYRGHTAIEKERFEKKVISEVDIRLSEIEKKAQQEGYQVGLEQGREEAKKEFADAYQAKIDELGKILSEIKNQSNEIIQDNLTDWHRLIKNSVKWILLKETKNSDYIESLLGRLIHEINEKDHLLVKIDEETNQYIEKAVAAAESELGKLSNLRIEIDHELKHPSIIVEGQNGIIDGSLEAQFACLDNVFSSLGDYEPQE